ncbi:MAG: undecaprenyl/decaprenyl-phosphate alpha-N-acetylglucosaminyl 1-phosphate transferase [Hyphomicrobiales bacterium]|nr:undecaprenyl/decaprenyl-phosphate alpha-N-acetylglucosaminyl 1-phosphate transferase [Hyphomicrobiales bacterium]
MRFGGADYLATGLFSLLISFLVIPPMARIAEQLGIVDHPEDRKVHFRPTPLCGGAAMAIAGVLSIALWTPLEKHALILLFSGGLVLAVGIYDDFRGLSFQCRLGWQIVAALIAISAGVTFVRLPFVELTAAPLWVAAPLTLIFLVGTTNAVNLLDGLDGLAGGITLLSFLTLGLLASDVGADALAIAAAISVGAILGFLRYNSHAAVVFMGDAGSTVLGFTLAVLGVLLIQAGQGSISAAILAPLIGLPIVDTTQVMATRLSRGESPFRADRRHLHHRLLDLGFSKAESVISLYGVQSMFVFTALTMRHAPGVFIAPVFFTEMFLVLGAVYGAIHLGWRRSSVGNSATTHGLNSVCLRRPAWKTKQSLPFLGIALGACLVAAASIPVTVAPEVALFAATSALLLLFDHPRLSSYRTGILRMGVFTVVLAFGAMAIQWSEASITVGPTSAVGGMLLLLCVAVAVSGTRRDVFPLSSLDALTVFIALGLLVAMLAHLVAVGIGGPLLAMISLFLTAEYCIVNDAGRSEMLHRVTLLSLAILATRGIAG